MRIYSVVQNQHIMGFGDVVDINFVSVEFIMDLYGVENKRECFERVLTLYRRAAENLRAERGA